MFTGIIEELGMIEKIESSRDPWLFFIRAKKTVEGLAKGDSVSVNGTCLTVVQVRKDGFSAEVIKETLNKTVLGGLKAGDRVNLEGALRANAKISGHFVTGHVDGVGKILKKTDDTGSILIEIEAQKNLLDGMVEKGSIAVDGISLTIVDVKASSFSVHIIPHTAKETTLGFKEPGSKVNLEVDMLGKLVRKCLIRNEPSAITKEFLQKKGFI